ncbi:uncharacterized protein LACBIDRAFT_328413 [Laccaria bicolor S238N-H82]|uniref:Predicted protein n=1 Tax=Laccaria bicolor (strain S238N-H82 / ATCC MYA-4686) TaxID=486041 RepID=B0DET1_LACBS|nr:uncharacterized protein LACBIDRAFT_328413 [Laccaria bicolor S238N-H82]EDR07082.1 predicted protein [Laccaria bicolor S238N-H82]|eukprot:XP_001882455.1 predicted protein [Laccaria bicolor S238N-H82]
MRFRKLREGATTIVSWEISPKKEGTCPKRVIDTDRLQKIADILQKLQKLDIDHKVFAFVITKIFVVSAFLITIVRFFDYNCPLFRLQMFVVIAFVIINACSCPLFSLQCCSVRFLDYKFFAFVIIKCPLFRLQMFVVFAFVITKCPLFGLQRLVVCTF